jgi:hypothetical protein
MIRLMFNGCGRVTRRWHIGPIYESTPPQLVQNIQPIASGEAFHEHGPVAILDEQTWITIALPLPMRGNWTAAKVAV